MPKSSASKPSAIWSPVGVTFFPIFASWLALPALLYAAVGLPGPIEGFFAVSSTEKGISIGVVTMLAAIWGFAAYRQMASTTRDAPIFRAAATALALGWITMAASSLAWPSHAPSDKDQIRATFYMASAFAAAIAGVLTWGRTSALAWQTQLAFQAQSQAGRAADREHVNDLLAKASEQLAHEKDIVQAAAVFGLERVYDQAAANLVLHADPTADRPTDSDSFLQRTVVEMLCSFVRTRSREHANAERRPDGSLPDKYRSPTAVLAAIEVLGRLEGTTASPSTDFDLSDSIVSELRWADLTLPAIRAPRLTVTGRVRLRGVTATGIVDFSRARFLDQFDADNLEAPKGFKAVDARFAMIATFRKSNFGGFGGNFTNSRFVGASKWDNATFSNPKPFGGAEARGPVSGLTHGIRGPEANMTLTVQPA